MTKATLPAEALSQHLAIVGRTGSGKTYTAKGLVEQLLEDQRRVCILDPTGAWYGLRSSADGRKAGYPVAVFGGAHGDVPIAEYSGAALAAILAEKNLPAIIDLSEMLIGQRHRFVTDFAEAIYRLNKAAFHLVIDEADEFCPQNPMPETKRMLHHVDRIVRRGRIKGFRVMLITQRPAVLHKNVLTQANTLIAMRLTAPQDRKAIQAWVEGQADASKAKAVLESLASLKRGEGWVWAPEHDLLERVTFPRIRTFDSSRAPDEDETIAEPAKLADVDLDGIKASFEAIEQEVETVAELKAELAKLKRLKTPETSGVSEADVQRRIREAVAEALKHSKPAASNLHKTGDIARAEHAIRRMMEIGAKALDSTNAPRAAEAAPRDLGKLAHRAQPPAPRDGLSGPEQRILDAIAWMASIGVPEPDQAAVAFLSGYSGASNGAYKNPRGALNQRGLVRYVPGGAIALTSAGAAIANQPEAIASLEQLHARVLSKLGGPEQRILRRLLEVYPKPLPNDRLAMDAGYSDASNGAYKNPRGRLRTFGLIDYRDGGVVARDVLFPNSRSK
jgi:hypothetical protein